MATRQSGNALDERDDDEEVTVADLREFGNRVTTSIVETIRRELDERDRLEARRDRLAGADMPATVEAALPQGDHLTALANRLGITPETLTRAAAAAKAAEQAEELRPFFADWLREELPAALDELVDDQDDDAAISGRKRASTAKKPAATSARSNGNGSGAIASNEATGTPPDSTPGDQHWGERRLFGSRR